jgi:hypothetical protein
MGPPVRGKGVEHLVKRVFKRTHSLSIDYVNLNIPKLTKLNLTKLG